MTLLLVALAGGLGASTRFVVDGIVNARRRGDLPMGSMTVNLVGSFLLGVLASGLTQPHPDLRLVLGTGFCGGFTTFSTAMIESARLLVEGRARQAVLLTTVMAVTAVALAAAGFALGTALA